jgi:hypothetical protein
MRIQKMYITSLLPSLSSTKILTSFQPSPQLYRPSHSTTHIHPTNHNNTTTPTMPSPLLADLEISIQFIAATILIYILFAIIYMHDTREAHRTGGNLPPPVTVTANDTRRCFICTEYTPLLRLMYATPTNKNNKYNNNNDLQNTSSPQTHGYYGLHPLMNRDNAVSQPQLQQCGEKESLHTRRIQNFLWSAEESRE